MPIISVLIDRDPLITALQSGSNYEYWRKKLSHAQTGINRSQTARACLRHLEVRDNIHSTFENDLRKIADVRALTMIFNVRSVVRNHIKYWHQIFCGYDETQNLLSNMLRLTFVPNCWL